MRAGWARELLAALLIAAAAALACSPAMARNDTPRTDTPQAGRWQWLAHTYWYVPRANLLALASSPARRTPAPVSDQTVYYISNYADGYFWGTTAVSYTRPGGSAASAQVSCLQLVGSVTPEGDVHLTFTPLSAKPAPSGGSDSEPTVGFGTMTRQWPEWTMENQMSTIAAGNLLLTHWAYMYQCKPNQPCFAALPGVWVSVPEFLAPCVQGGG